MQSPTSFVLTNARLILRDTIVENGWLAVENGVIAEIGDGEVPHGTIDCLGDTIIPGLIELHTDHLESHYAPRPKVRWDPLNSVIAYDAQIATSGITTVFDSLRVGSEADSGSLGNEVHTLAEAISKARDSGLLRVEHRTHLRCEVSAPDVLRQTENYLARFPAHMMSLMDHTPGQRQFTSLEGWKRFYTRKSPYSEAELDAFAVKRQAAHAEYAVPNRRRLVEIARMSGIVLASHDDATAAHVAESVGDGVRIAEFPTTQEAAAASRAADVKVMMGAPNIIRGGSHTGNVAAQDLAKDGLLDILSSDYVPLSLLMAAFQLPRRVPAMTLPEAVRTVTLNPAEATGLTDRGVLEPGRRADLVRVAWIGDAPVARQVFSAGRRIA